MWDFVLCAAPRFDPFKAARTMLRGAYEANKPVEDVLAPVRALEAEILGWYVEQPIPVLALSQQETHAQYELDHLQLGLTDETPPAVLERVEAAAGAHRNYLDLLLRRVAQLRRRRTDDDFPRPMGVSRTLRRA